MKKITELTEKRWRTVHKKDAYGNRTREKEEYSASRFVRTVQAGPRFGHYIADTIAYYILMYSFGFLISFLTVIFAEGDPSAIVFINFFAAIFNLLFLIGFYSLSEYLWQKTPGKFLTKTVVIDEYAQKPALGKLLLRSVIRLVPFEAFSCLGDKNKCSRGWHDRWTNTWVVTEEERDNLQLLLGKEIALEDELHEKAV